MSPLSQVINIWAKWTKIYGLKYENLKVKLLGITSVDELKFDEHICNVCMKAQRTLIVLTRIRKYLAFDKLRIFFV